MLQKLGDLLVVAYAKVVLLPAACWWNGGMHNNLEIANSAAVISEFGPFMSSILNLIEPPQPH